VGLDRRLTEAAGLGRTNEPFLEACLEEIDSAGPAPAAQQLLLVRLIELALWTAGGYADGGELAAAGDLLVNPRRKLLLVAGRSEPILLDRHTPLTDQVVGLGLVPAGADRPAVVTWLKERTRLLIDRPPLLAELLHRLRAQPVLAPGYAGSVEERMGRIASTISFLANLRLPAGRSIQEKLRLVSQEERDFLESRLCRFDLELFHLLAGLAATTLPQTPPGPGSGARDLA